MSTRQRQPTKCKCTVARASVWIHHNWLYVLQFLITVWISKSSRSVKSLKVRFMAVNEESDMFFIEVMDKFVKSGGNGGFSHG